MCVQYTTSGWTIKTRVAPSFVITPGIFTKSFSLFFPVLFLVLANSRLDNRKSLREQKSRNIPRLHFEFGRKYEQFALVPPVDTICSTFTRPSTVVDGLQPHHILHSNDVRHGRERQRQLIYREYMTLLFSSDSRF